MDAGKKRSRNATGWLYGALGQILWGASPVLVSLISKALPTTLLVSIRHGMGAILLGSNILISNRRAFKDQPWLHLIILGLVAGSLPDLFMVESVRHAGPIVAIMLARLEIPLGVLFAHLLLKEQVTKRVYLSSLLGIIGAFFVSYKPGLSIDLGSGFYFGVLMGLGAGITWSLTSVYGKYILNRQADPLILTFMRLGLGSLATLIVTILFIDNPLRILANLQPDDWLMLIYLGLFASGLGYLFFYRSLNIIDAHIAQILIGITIMVGVLLSLAIGVDVSAWQWLGILIIGWSLYLIKPSAPRIEPPD